MKKLLIALAGVLMVVTLVACGSNKDEAIEKPVEGQTEVEPNENGETTTESETETEEVETFTFEGIVEEKRDLTITVKANDSDDAYIFNLPEGFETEIEAGTKVIVTYTGDKDDIDAQLNAVSVIVIE